MKDTKLKPCPFCGGEAEVKTGQDGMYDKYIVCTACGCRTKTFNEYFNIRDYATEQMRLGKVNSVCRIIIEESTKKATEVWNRRYCK